MLQRIKQSLRTLWQNNLFEVILLLMLFIAGVFVVGSKEYVDENCHYEYPYKNTLQHDINRKLVCKGDK